jgi:hypothetical protein
MRRGCPFGTVANEVTENDEIIRQDLGLFLTQQTLENSREVENQQPCRFSGCCFFRLSCAAGSVLTLCCYSRIMQG